MLKLVSTVSSQELNSHLSHPQYCLCSRPGAHGLLFQILHLVPCYVCDKAALLLTCLISTRTGWNHHLAWSQKPNAWKAGCSLYSLISFGADSCGLVILGAVDVGAVVEGAVAAADGPAPALVDKVPVEAGVGPVLSALVLHEERALLRAELLQVPAGTGMSAPGSSPPQSPVPITEVPSLLLFPGWRLGAAGVCNGKISITHRNVTRAEITFCQDHFWRGLGNICEKIELLSTFLSLSKSLTYVSKKRFPSYMFS